MTAVITGIGVTAPTGLGTQEFWGATLDGKSAIASISRYDASSYPVRLCGEITGFDATEHIPGRLLPQTDRMTQLALTAADLALADAGLSADDLNPQKTGVATAGAAGGFEFGQKELQTLWSQGPQYVSAYQSFAWFYAVNTGQLSIKHDTRGPSNVVVSEQAGGLDALAVARRRIRQGTTVMIAGGLDAPLSPWAMAAQIPNGRMSRSLDPDRAYLPFHEDACGYVPGEGGALLIVEDERTARRRAAPRIYARIAGHCSTFDSDRRGPTRLASCIEGAIADAELSPRDIDVVFADAAGVPALDQDEAEALVRVFGPRRVPVTAPKTMTGRMYSGGAAVDVAMGLLALADDIIPPTANVGRPAPGYGIDLVTSVRPSSVNTALIIARGYHGFNSALVLTGVDGENVDFVPEINPEQTRRSRKGQYMVKEA
ncbi:ketosynthase chain-length factor [Streptomyces sp. NPDC059176]|uniref:ketosynthase chain-length factor n=1 Tax=Streptomyces sp. NPDC059176 TaxID=3346758 RepID=UPI00368827A5